MTTGRPRGVRNWDREPYRDVPPITTGGKVKISTSIEPATRERFHAAARAAGVSLSYLLDQLAERFHIDEKTGTVTVDGKPITSPQRGQEALVIPA